MIKKVWPAPAKLNLFLHITGRRSDGYHQLQTVFQFLDYHDELYFSIRQDNQITLTPALKNVANDDNLVIRAARLLQQKTRCDLGVDIQIEKRLPLGGGIGGGSSNAATTLVALNQIWNLGVSLEDLMALGLTLGADVPIFIKGEASWAEGIGEKLSPINLPEPWYLLLIPPCQVSTREIFLDSQLTRDTSAIKIHNFLSGHGRNDFEPVVRRRYPEVAEALDWLAQFAPARMTGTGACVFAAFADFNTAAQVAEQITAPFKGVVTKGLNRSPLCRATA